MIKALFFDVDGTLVSFRQKFLSDGLLADLAALRERGIRIFLSTGRALQDLERTGMLRGARFDGYVTINGQFCCDGDGVPFLDRPIGESWLTRIDDRVREIYRFLHTEPYPVCPLEELISGKVYQFVPFVTPEEAKPFLDVMPGCIHTRWHPKGLDIIPKDGGKDVGVRAAMERYGFARDEIMAFGDGENDMPMLRLAGTAVAMGNAEEPVKKLADYVTAEVEENGVSQALRHFDLLP